MIENLTINEQKFWLEVEMEILFLSSRYRIYDKRIGRVIILFPIDTISRVNLS